MQDSREAVSLALTVPSDLLNLPPTGTVSALMIIVALTRFGGTVTVPLRTKCVAVVCTFTLIKTLLQDSRLTAPLLLS